MTLRLTEGWTRVEPIGNWPLSGEPHHATSRAYELLCRDLHRYSRDEIAGRSYLIAGHRGAGKTTMVARAILEVRNRILQESASAEASTLGRRPRLQRPLLVKLIGQSLITPPPRLPSEKADGSYDTADQADEKHDQVESALVHIAIALYRALAQEVASGFAIHAGGCAPRERDARLELAAQLALDLDGGPEPSSLRRYWSSIGRLSKGILWPENSDETLRARSIYDQGLREIMAVATAGQTYQICSGRVSYAVTKKATAVDDSRIDSSIDVKGVVERLGALMAGGVVGGTVAGTSNSLSGVGAGVAVWLLSATVLKITGMRQQKSDDTADFKFIRDRSIQTLDRELPIVIDRVRNAGLAPVFVIDELDKLDAESDTITQIFNRLKHLVADYGFFCFLTNRDYYDRIERKVAVEAYPTEHTYFSERLLIYNRPEDLFVYLVALVSSDAKTPEGRLNETDKLAASIFALAVIYRSKLNFTDVAREVAHLAGPDDRLIIAAEDMPNRFDMRLAATIQLAINEVLRAEPIATRFRDDPTFAQMAIDALYYVSRCWERNNDEAVSLCPEDIEADLIARIQTRGAASRDAEQEGGLDAPNETSEASDADLNNLGPGSDAILPETADGDAVDHATDLELGSKPAMEERVGAGGGSEDGGTPPISISPPDLRVLIGMTVDLAAYLVDFKALAAAVRMAPGANDWRLGDVVLTSVETGLIQASPKDFCYHFLLDERAGSLKKTPVKWIGEDERVAMATARNRIASFKMLLDMVRLSGDDLFDLGLLPGESRSTPLIEALVSFDSALSRRLWDEGVTRARVTANALGDALDQHGFAIGMLVLAVAALKHDRPDCDTSNVLHAITRHAPLAVLDPTVELTDLPVGLSISRPRLNRDPQSVEAFADILQQFVTGMKGRKPAAMANTWPKWQKTCVAHLTARAPDPLSVSYADLLAAAGKQTPGSLFRYDPADMTIADWSRLVIAALRDNEEGPASAPSWALFAGLRALGFDAGLIQHLAKPGALRYMGPWEKGDDLAIAAIVDKAPDRPRGLLFVSLTDDLAPHGADKPQDRPILIISQAERSRYSQVLEWLAEADAFEGVVNESDR
jgi:hypothetical protein